MASESFRSVVLEGHKGAAVEVPFDPQSRWSVAAEPLWRGRRGHAVRGRLNGVRFESWIVPRSKKFWMLVENALLKSARASVGDTVEITLEPVATAKPPERLPKPSARTKTAHVRSAHARSPKKRAR